MKPPKTPKAYAEYLYCYPLSEASLERLGVEATALIQTRVRAFLDGVRWANRRAMALRRRVNKDAR